MAVDPRQANRTWTLVNAQDHWGISPVEYHGMSLALLMDLRDELQKLNRLLHCPNFQQIPARLAAIERHTKARKYKKRAQKE